MFKILSLILLALTLFSCTAPKDTVITRKYFNEKGDSLSKAEFQLKWRKSDRYSRWDSISNGKRYLHLSAPEYEQYVISYTPFLRNIEKLTRKKLSNNAVVLIGYTYKDDLCSSTSPNSWRKGRIQKRKKFVNPIKKQIEATYEHLVYLDFFEEGITLSNNPESEKEYFFQDKDNFLRNTIFKNPALCGSYALIRPDGKVLVRNGEYRADDMAVHLDPVNWTQFFPGEE